MSRKSVPTRGGPRGWTIVAKALAICAERAVSYARAVAFWGAIVSPIVLVFALGVGLSGERPLLFAGLLLGSVGCTVVGHGHVPSRLGDADAGTERG